MVRFFSVAVAFRVEVSLRSKEKHQLPVEMGCSYQHPVGFAKHSVPCKREGGLSPNDQASSNEWCLI